MPPRNVIVAVDGSQHSIRAFNWYTETFKLNNDQVIIAHVCETPFIPHPTFANGATCNTTKEQWEKDEKKVMAITANFEDKCKFLKVCIKPSQWEKDEKKLTAITADFENKCKSLKLPYESVCMHGHVGEALCHLAKEKNAACVILGNRGLGTIRRTILGSNSDYVVKHATTPVLLVPPLEE